MTTSCFQGTYNGLRVICYSITFSAVVDPYVYDSGVLRINDLINAEGLNERPGVDPRRLRRAGAGNNEHRARGDQDQPTVRMHPQARHGRFGAIMILLCSRHSRKSRLL